MREDSALDARGSIQSGLSLTHSMTQRESTQLTRKVESKFDKYQKKLDKENKRLGPETEQRNNEVIKHLSTLIKRNKSLIFLDLSQT